MEEIETTARDWRRGIPRKRKIYSVIGILSWRNLSVRSTGIFIGLIGWSVVTGFGWVTPSLLPTPWDVLATMYHLLQNGVLIEHMLSSLKRVILGFLVAFSIALPIGLVMGLWESFRKAVDPVIELLRPIPPIAIIPLGILWFGIGEFSKVFIIAYAAFFPIALNVVGGIRQVDSIHIKAAQTLGANPMQIFYYVTLRSAIPNIIIGMRSGISMAFISLVAAELIASNSGLGFLIQEARYVFKTDEVMVGMITIGLLGFFINRILIELEKYLIRWK